MQTLLENERRIQGKSGVVTAEQGKARHDENATTETIHKEVVDEEETRK